MIPVYRNALPDGWEERPLREIVKRRRGYSWDKDQETNRTEPGAIAVVRIPNIQGELDLSDILWLRDVSEQDVTDFTVAKDWIVFVASNGNPDRIGDSVLFVEDHSMLFASFLQAIKAAEPERLLPAFLWHWMRLPRVHEIFSKTSQQTTGLANFSWDAVKRLPVRYPTSPDAQHDILRALDAADAALRRAQRELASAQALRRSLLQQLFTRGLPGRHRFRKARFLRHHFEIPETWSYERLGGHVLSVEYGTNAASNDHKTGYPVVGIPQVIDPVLSRGDWPYAEVSEDEATQLRLCNDDVLLVRTNGNPEYIGKSTVVPESVCGEHVVFASYLIRVRTKEAELKGRYLNHFLHSPLGRRESLTMANTSAGNHNIGSRALKQFWIPLPSPAEQDKIVEALDAAQAQIEAINAKVEALGKLGLSLLDSLLTGKAVARQAALA